MTNYLKSCVICLVLLVSNAGYTQDFIDKQSIGWTSGVRNAQVMMYLTNQNTELMRMNMELQRDMMIIRQENISQKKCLSKDLTISCIQDYEESQDTEMLKQCLSSAIK